VEQISNSLQNLENILPALTLIQEILKKLHELCLKMKCDVQTVEEDQLKKAVENFNQFYINMCHMLLNTQEDYLDVFKLRYDTFNIASSILIEIQRFADPFITRMPQWLTKIIECSNMRRTKIVLVTIKTFFIIVSQPINKISSPLWKIQQ